MSTGIEIKKGGEILFRGGAYQYNSDVFRWHLINEDGTSFSPQIIIGVTTNESSSVSGEAEPSLTAILDLVYGPELTNKGHWGAWFVGIFLSILVAVTILFADELFRWELRRKIQDYAIAEPSDWEITTRYIGWTAMTVLILVLYIKGLQ